MKNGRAKSPRELALLFFEQLRASGETEIYLAPDRMIALRAESGPGRRLAEPVQPDDGPKHGEGSAPARAARPAEKKLGSGEATLAGYEIVRVNLPFAAQRTTGDMFAASAALETLNTLEGIERATVGCEKCELANGRTNIVFGVGNPRARLMFVGEAPGRDEDLQGVPFVGRAGQLLDKILEAAEIERDDVYIANIIKCRPPNNRTPLTNEIEACMPYLGKQVAIIRPRIICTLGLPATQTILGIRGSMGSLRGKVYVDGDVKVIPTYHPAAALRDPRYKRPIWDDIRLVKQEYLGE
jgi:uracil-DNA glycosylase